MLNKKYFRLGVRRMYEELEQMQNKPGKLCSLIEDICSADSDEQIRDSLTALIRETVLTFRRTRAALPVRKGPVTADSVGGTYEEMFSNWRNKMYVAATENNRHLAFMSMISFNAMFSEIGAETEIDDYAALKGYDPQNPEKTAAAFDELLRRYLSEYDKAGLSVEHYRDIDAFADAYLK